MKEDEKDLEIINIELILEVMSGYLRAQSKGEVLEPHSLKFLWLVVSMIIETLYLPATGDCWIFEMWLVWPNNRIFSLEFK